MIADTLKRAVNLVRANPEAVEALDARDAAAANAAEAEAKQRATVEGRIAKALPDRVEALIDDFVAVGQDALRAAATQLAQAQLEIEHGIAQPETVAMTGLPTRIAPSRVDALHGELSASAPVPWDKQHRPGDELSSNYARVAAEAVAAARRGPEPKPVTADEAKRHEARQRNIAERKQAAREAGILS